MRVLHVSADIGPGGGGVARHIDGLCRAGAIHGLRCEAAGTLAEARRRLGAVDLVHLHGARSPLAAAVAPLARSHRRPLVYTPHCYYDHGSWPKRAVKRVWDRTAERLLFHMAARVVLLADSWRTDVAARGLPVDARVAVVPNCVLDSDLEERRIRGGVVTLTGRPALVSVARLDPVKRLGDAILALRQPGLEHAVLHLIGDGPAEAGLRRLAARCGVAHRVTFHGRLGDAEAAAAVAAADVFVLPSEREGLPTAMLEAMLLGTSVVASDAIGCAAVAGVCGWRHLHPVGDVAALARQVQAAEPPATPQLDALRRHFTWEWRIGDLMAVYRAALCGGGSGASGSPAAGQHEL